MITLYHGTPGSGKSNYIVEMILKIVREQNKLPPDERRPVFANIMGLDIETVELPDDDFREHPPGSIIFYDEAQEIPHYSSDSRANNPIAKALSTHRSRYGVDIHFITQDPDLLHRYVLKNTSEHHYLWRPANRRAIDVYIWNRAMKNPSKSDFSNCYDTFRRSLNPECFDYYDSTPVDTHKHRTSKKKWSTIATGMMFFSAIAYFVVPYVWNTSKQNPATQATESQPKETISSSPSEDNLQSLGNGLYFTPSSTPQVSLPPPVTDKYQFEHIRETAYNEDARPAAIIRDGKRCIVYNSYGERLNYDLSMCKMMSNETGMMPRQRNQRQNNDNIQTTSYNLYQQQS